MVNVDGKPMSHTHSVLQQNEDTMKLSHDDESLQNNNQLNETKSNVEMLEEPLQGGDDDSNSTSENNFINIGENGTSTLDGSVNQFSNGIQYNIYYHTNKQHNLEQNKKVHLEGGNDDSTVQKQPASHTIGVIIAANSNVSIPSVNQLINSNQCNYLYHKNQQYNQILNSSSVATVNDDDKSFVAIATSKTNQYVVTTKLEAKRNPHVVTSGKHVINGSRQNNDNKLHLNSGNDDSTAKKQPASHTFGINIAANSNVHIQSVNQVINSNQCNYRYVENQQYHQFEDGFPVAVKNVNDKPFRARFKTETPSHMVMTQQVVKKNKHVTANGNHNTSTSINPVSDSILYINHYYD